MFVSAPSVGHILVQSQDLHSKLLVQLLFHRMNNYYKLAPHESDQGKVFYNSNHEEGIPVSEFALKFVSYMQMNAWLSHKQCIDCDLE